jgi:uncharacterized Rossmann fold enzyme
MTTSFTFLDSAIEKGITIIALFSVLFMVYPKWTLAAALQNSEKRGAIMVVHAHGDNIDMIKKMVPKFRKVVGTTQVMPLANVHNFGGFTDGDRAVFLAEEFGAKKVVLVGMDLGDSIGKYSKEHVKDP